MASSSFAVEFRQAQRLYKTTSSLRQPDEASPDLTNTMDPLSISAFVISLVGITAKFSESAGRFSIDQSFLPDDINDFKVTISSLHSALRSIATELDNNRPELPSEKAHRQDIFRILKSCEASLKKLGQLLPELGENPGPLDRARQSLLMSLKRNVIQNLLSHISSYTEVLHLSLLTLSLYVVKHPRPFFHLDFSGSMRAQQESQEQVQARIRELTDTIRSRMPVMRQRPILVWDDDETITGGAESLMREIQAWRMSADDVAAGVTLQVDRMDRRLSSPSLGSLPLQKSARRDTSTSLTGDEDAESDDFDPEPDREIGPGKDILQFQYEANQEIVKQLEDCGIFLRASAYQRKGIAIKEKLGRPGCDVSFPFAEQAAMKERLADILLACETEKETMEAKAIIQDLLSAEVKQPECDRNTDRLSRLYHKLGDLHFRMDDLPKATKFLGRALEGRKSREPMRTEDARMTAELLVKVQLRAQAFDEARGLQRWIREELGPDGPPTEVLSVVYSWCQEQGFDINSAHFSFDTCDSALRTSPLHLAVQEQAIEILRQIVAYGANLENGDDDNADLPTPLLLAATTRNPDIVRLLLQHDACSNVRDGIGMTPLHRCQSQSGGVEIAALLLESEPGLLDLVDKGGKTALYMACEMGNEEMVEFLLQRGANPNICQTLQGSSPASGASVICTPLIVGIEVAATNFRKVRIVEKLLRHGANPSQSDGYGGTAFTAANNAGLAGSEIRRLLQHYAPAPASPAGRRTSSRSDSTVSARKSYQSNTGSSGIASLECRLGLDDPVSRRVGRESLRQVVQPRTVSIGEDHATVVFGDVIVGPHWPKHLQAFEISISHHRAHSCVGTGVNGTFSLLSIGPWTVGPQYTHSSGSPRTKLGWCSALPRMTNNNVNRASVLSVVRCPENGENGGNVIVRAGTQVPHELIFNLPLIPSLSEKTSHSHCSCVHYQLIISPRREASQGMPYRDIPRERFITTTHHLE
ncbi:hypothetical protein ACRALDRAFT_213564 [Sodiomyces alcalophilus JCM 7366]|uniref:uncharacterized protein n=1 Tax=Sodiomyces alcalophilus JCM 7366 TaxID=591952 RepID=UPI0039B4AA0E